MKFCEKWEKTSPVNIVTIDDAEIFHNQSKTYIAYYESENIIKLYLKITSEAIFIKNLDNFKRPIRSFAFNYGEKKKRCFLREVICWEYSGDSDSWDDRIMYDFVGNKLYKETFSRVTKEKHETCIENDNSKYWFEIPKFNSYDNLIKVTETVLDDLT